MRLSPDRLAEITGHKRPRAQAAWFRDYLAANVPCDRVGPFLSESAYEALLARALGLVPSNPGSRGVDRPQVRLRGA